MKGVTRIEGLEVAPDFPFRLLLASENPLWASGDYWAQSNAWVTLRDFGNSGVCLLERDRGALARVGKPGSAPGSGFLRPDLSGS